MAANTTFERNVWTYPWDVLDLGELTVIEELRSAAHSTGISLAAAYHAGHFLQPRSPKQKVYFPEDGSVYFRPDSHAYAGIRIQPRMASLVSDRDVLRSLGDMRETEGFGLNAWIVCLHNTRIGTEYHDVTTVNAFGNRNIYNLCPSNPDARAYVNALVSDISHRYALDSIELEACHFMGFAHEYHHEKDAVGLTSRDDFLFSLCFCPHCRERAAAQGVDVDLAQRTVQTLLEESLERAVPIDTLTFFDDGPEQFQEYPELYDFIRWRFEPVTSLVAEIREHTREDVDVHFLSLGSTQAWTYGADLNAISAKCDGLVVTGYGLSPDQLHSTMASIVPGVVEAGKHFAVGLRLYYPECPNPHVLAKQVQGVRDLGATGVNFYNYGLIPRARLEWIGQANAALRG